MHRLPADVGEREVGEVPAGTYWNSPYIGFIRSKP